MKTLHFVLVVTVLAVIGVTSGQDDAYASTPSNDLGDGNVFSMTTNGAFFPGNYIEIDGNLVAVNPIKITLDDPHGIVIASKTTFSDRTGNFISELKIHENATSGTWNIIGTSGIYHKELNFTIMANSITATCYAGNLCQDVLPIAQNITNSTIPPNAIKTPSGGWVTALQTHDESGNNLTIHYETGISSSGSGEMLHPGPPPDPLFLTDSLGNNDNFITNHQILIRADIYSESPDVNTGDIEINMTSDTGFSFDDKRHLTFDPDANHMQQIIWQFTPVKPGNYTIEKFSNGMHTSDTLFSVLDSKTNQGSPVLVSPFRQFKWGVLPQNIECKTGLEHMSTTDGSPACVTSDTENTLIQRGWTKETTSANLIEISTGNQTTSIIPSCVSNIQNQYALAGFRGDELCPVINFQASGNIVNYTGFYGVYRYTAYPATSNFVLEPGHNGTITYQINVGEIHSFNSNPPANEINVTNDIEFMHDAGMYNHPGVQVSSSQESEIIQKNGSAFIDITFAVSKDAKPGTYWVDLPPGFCIGGEVIILTITDCEK